jgi:tRNA U34 5-carboxymethylaminomethyl modifying GTPase MnmE/TrmE
VLNKDDISVQKDKSSKLLNMFKGLSTYSISCRTGNGVQQLEDAISEKISSLLNLNEPNRGASVNSGGAMITRERHRRHVKVCLLHLNRFLNYSLPMDAAAEELRYLYSHILLCFHHFNAIYV